MLVIGPDRRDRRWAGMLRAAIRRVLPLPAAIVAQEQLAPGAREAMMSCLVIRPRVRCGNCERLTPCSRAILRTSGEERASSALRLPPVVQAERCSFVRELCWSRLLSSLFRRRRGAAAVFGGAAAASPSTAMYHDRVHADRCALRNLISCRTPEAGAGISASTLSVEISNKRFVALYLVARLLQPLGNSAFNDGFAHLGHDDVIGMISFHAAHGSGQRTHATHIIAVGESVLERWATCMAGRVSIPVQEGS